MDLREMARAAFESRFREVVSWVRYLVVPCLHGVRGASGVGGVVSVLSMFPAGPIAESVEKLRLLRAGICLLLRACCTPMFVLASFLTFG